MWVDDGTPGWCGRTPQPGFVPSGELAEPDGIEHGVAVQDGFAFYHDLHARPVASAPASKGTR